MKDIRIKKEFVYYDYQLSDIEILKNELKLGNEIDHISRNEKGDVGYLVLKNEYLVKIYSYTHIEGRDYFFVNEWGYECSEEQNKWLEEIVNKSNIKE